MVRISIVHRKLAQILAIECARVTPPPEHVKNYISRADRSAKRESIRLRISQFWEECVKKQVVIVAAATAVVVCCALQIAVSARAPSPRYGALVFGPGDQCWLLNGD